MGDTLGCVMCLLIQGMPSIVQHPLNSSLDNAMRYCRAYYKVVAGLCRNCGYVQMFG